MKTIFGVIFRVALLLAALVFLASLLVVALLLLSVWLGRALWARLTGQPVMPWTFQFNRQTVMDRFYRASGQRPFPPPDANVIDVTDVIEVEPRQIKP